MPITIFNKKVQPNPSTKNKVESATALLQEACSDQRDLCDHVIRSSFDDAMLKEKHISPSENGFVFTLVEAYNMHKHVTLRPEEVWFAILAQFNYYINANAEELRHLFVAHEGQKKLDVTMAGTTIYEVGIGAFATKMTHLIQENVVDPELRDWIMPAWTTTTPTDQVVAAAIMMGCLQKYFNYVCSILCGLPSVTLLGEVDDWKDMLQRLDKLAQLGEEPARFDEELKPVLRRFVATFEAPTSPEVWHFWKRAVDYNAGSGAASCSGWVTAFCFWNSEGKRLGHGAWGGPLKLDGVSYREVDISSIPAGYSSVPVKVDDNGYEFDTTMVAGLVGIQASPPNDVQRGGNEEAIREGPGEKSAAASVSASVSSASETSASGAVPGLYALQPVSGWWMFKNREVPPQETGGEA